MLPQVGGILSGMERIGHLHFIDLEAYWLEMKLHLFKASCLKHSNKFF